MKNLLKFGGFKMNYRNVYLRKDGRYEGRVFWIPQDQNENIMLFRQNA